MENEFYLTSDVSEKDTIKMQRDVLLTIAGSIGRKLKENNCGQGPGP